LHFIKYGFDLTPIIKPTYKVIIVFTYKFLFILYILSNVELLRYSNFKIVLASIDYLCWTTCY